MWLPNGKGDLLRRYGEHAQGKLVVVSLTTEPTFTFGNPVVVPSGRLQSAAVSAPNSPRRFDMHPDGAIIGTVESGQTLIRGACRPAHRGRLQLVRRAEGARADEIECRPPMKPAARGFDTASKWSRNRPPSLSRRSRHQSRGATRIARLCAAVIGRCFFEGIPHGRPPR